MLSKITKEDGSMLILTPNPNYKFHARDDSNGGSDELVVKETWVENVYDIKHGDFIVDGASDKAMVMVDIGANIGAVSIFAASLDPKIHVFAFEPEHDNHELLMKNVRENRLTGQITVLKQAVSNYSGTGNISCSEGNSQLTSNKDDEQVQVITLADLFRQNKIDECDVLKIDIEGAEYPLLTDATYEDLMRVRFLTLEFSQTDAETFGKMYANLTRVFNLHSIGSYERGGMIYGRRY